MFRAKYNRRKVQRWLVVALALSCLVAFAVNLYFYLESGVVTNLVNDTATCANTLEQPKSYFDMSLNELMEVVVVSQIEGQPSSNLLHFNCGCLDLA